MMVRECTSTCYVLFWIVVVPASDPKDLFMERVIMFIVQSTGMIWVGLVEYHAIFFSFADIHGRRTGCDFLDLGDGVGLSPNLGIRGGLYRM
jgi:hypothetical protein